MRIMRPVGLVKVTSPKRAEPPAAIPAPTARRNADAPRPSAAANRMTPGPLGSRARTETSSGKEQGEKNEAIPAAAASP
jgi:hypothetical protein